MTNRQRPKSRLNVANRLFSLPHAIQPVRIMVLALYQSYMFFLFYSQYDPKLYQLQGGTVSGGFAETHKIGKYEFRPINWEKEDKVSSLFVGNVNDSPLGVSSKRVFKSLDNQGSILIYGQD